MNPGCAGLVGVAVGCYVLLTDAERFLVQDGGDVLADGGREAVAVEAVRW